jgi:hypothetical protein
MTDQDAVRLAFERGIDVAQRAVEERLRLNRDLSKRDPARLERIEELETLQRWIDAAANNTDPRGVK